MNKKQMKRVTAQCVQHSQRIVEKLLALKDEFIEPHPDWIPFFDGIINSQLMQIDFIVNLATIAWGYFPDDLDKWLK